MNTRTNTGADERGSSSSDFARGGGGGARCSVQLCSALFSLLDSDLLPFSLPFLPSPLVCGPYFGRNIPFTACRRRCFLFVTVDCLSG